MRRRKTISKPVEHRAVSKRSTLPAAGEPESATVTLLDVSLKGVTDQRIVTEGDRLRVSAAVGVDGLDRRRRYERIPVTRLSAKDIDPKLARLEIEGFRPAGVPTNFTPDLARPTHRLRPRKGKDPDVGGTIFGDCLLYTSPSPRDGLLYRMPSSA